LLSRRRFLQSGSAAAAFSAALPAAAHAKEKEQDKTLPPPIAQLKSLHGEATPISLDERRDRLEKARKLMRDNNLSAVLMTEGT
jgi:Xaa-Pro dipeptidase